MVRYESARYEPTRNPSARHPVILTRMVSIAALAFVAGGCTPLDNLLARVPIFAFMHDSPALGPYADPRPAPPGSVPFASPGGELRAPIERTEAAMVAFGETTPNPLPDSPEVLATGQAMYINQCAVCHGATGAGDGPVIGAPGEPRFPFRPPDLRAPASVARTDGYMYAVIRNGRSLMAPYGDRTSEDERWAIVHYIRRLQQGGGEAPPAAEEPAEATGSGPTQDGTGAPQERD